MDKRIKYYFNESCFDELNENSLYWLGLLYSDGCISKQSKGNSYQVTLALSQKDEEVLLKFKDFLKTNLPIKRYKNSFSGVSSIVICNQKVNQSLLKLGLIPRKSLIIKFPDFLKNHPLKHHFIRGYFDGDGCVCEKTHKNKKWLHTTITGTLDMMENFNLIFKKELDINPRKIIQQGNVYSIHIGKIDFVNKFKNYIYNGASTFLKRKFDIFNNHSELKFGTTSKYKSICYRERIRKWSVNFYDINNERHEKSGFLTEQDAFNFLQSKNT